MKKVLVNRAGMTSLTYKPDLPIELLLPDGFKCVGCVVFPNCSSLCGDLEIDQNKIDYLILEKQICPDCGGKPRPRKFTGNTSTYRCKRCGHLFVKLISDDGIEWMRFYEDQK